MSEAHGWNLDENQDTDQKTVPAGKSRFGINNMSSSQTAVHTLLNGTYLAQLAPGNAFEDMSCSPGNLIRIEAALSGKKASGCYTFD